MRIITGVARGCRLETLPGQDTRPTTDRVKEALFSILQFDIAGRRVLDLFAGSGQLGIEALSRGAASCTFVDRRAEAVAVIRRNLIKSRLTAHTQVLTVDAPGFLAQTGDTYDLVFLDPPYQSGLLLPTLAALEPHLVPGALVTAETDSDVPPPSAAGGCSLVNTYRYGKIRLWLYRKEASL